MELALLESPMILPVFLCRFMSKKAIEVDAITNILKRMDNERT
ncbi:hypothetical protein BVI434_540045 [Burkholderia vietnamiensis]|nr:hypothetical protein BVI434_540045 [Burkholderia vietnamiensis]